MESTWYPEQSHRVLLVPSAHFKKFEDGDFGDVPCSDQNCELENGVSDILLLGNWSEQVDLDLESNGKENVS